MSLFLSLKPGLVHNVLSPAPHRLLTFSVRWPVLVLMRCSVQYMLSYFEPCPLCLLAGVGALWPVMGLSRIVPQWPLAPLAFLHLWPESSVCVGKIPAILSFIQALVRGPSESCLTEGFLLSDSFSHPEWPHYLFCCYCCLLLVTSCDAQKLLLVQELCLPVLKGLTIWEAGNQTWVICMPDKCPTTL